MSESTLSLGFSEFAVQVCRELGFSPTLASCSADEQLQVSEIIQSGYRQFLYPPPLPGVQPHEWSFLKGYGTFTTASGTYNYACPDDFDGFEGELTFATTDNQRGPIQVVGENVIRSYREAGGTSTGVPRFVALKTLTLATGTTGQRWEAIFWPTPGAAYTLTFKYQKFVALLSAAVPYPIGGMVHGETILASCQQRASEVSNDDPTGYMQKFISRMVASIQHDRQRNEREYYGNQNGEDIGLYRMFPSVLYNGA